MQQIANWLKELGMSEYTERFVENHIDESIIRELTDQDLKDLGVMSLGHRRKLLRAIQELGETPATLTATKSEAMAATVQIPQEGPERRQLTVMFCDLVRSTSRSARLDPEDLGEVIGTYHRCCTEQIVKSGGFVARYLGDGVLAYFGYPRAHEHDAELAVRTGLALVEAVPKLETPTGFPLQVRVGIATGLVVVGDLIGAGAAHEQTVVGETPNLAARLQALAEPSAVVIASNTRTQIGGLFEYRDLGAVALKGFAKNVPAWQVLGAGATESRFEALHATSTPLIGRDEEIDMLLRRWEQAKGGDGQVVLITGEPGIGKSRIPEVILERLSNEPYIRLRYFCSPHHQDSALYPSIAQLERAAGFRSDDTDDERLDKLEVVLAQATNDLSEAVPLLADLLSISTGERYLPLSLTPQKRKERTLHAQLAQVEGLAAQQPVVMVWEDVHWSDPTTRESLDLLVERVPTLRVLLIITFRPEFAPRWIGRPQVTLLALSRLSPRQRTEMIGHLTGGKALPKEIADQIVDRTDGVPLFIEELTKSVVESGLVAEAGDRYAATGPVGPLAVPTTLHASLLARLDRLAPTREIAQIGAALGRSFSHTLISAVAQMPQHQIDDALAQLVNAELIFQRGTPPDAEYRFKHALVQDAAYDTLLRSKRQQLHARIVARLEDAFPQVVTVQPAVLARHSAEAGLAERAVGYWLKAGQQAVRRGLNHEAISDLTKGLEQLNKPSHNLENLRVGQIADEFERTRLEVELLVTLGAAFMATRGFGAQEVLETYSKAEALCERLGERADIFPALWGQWLFRWGRSELDDASRLCVRLLALAEKSGDAGLKLQAHHAAWATSFGRGELTEVHEHARAGLALYDENIHRAMASRYGNHDASACARWFSALSLALEGEEELARSMADSSLAVARGLNDPFSLALSLYFASAMAQVLGDTEVSAQRAEASRQIATEHDLALVRAWSAGVLGWCMAETGDPDRGLGLLTEAIAALRATRSRQFLSYLVGLLAEAHMKAGQHADAMKAVEDGIALADASGERYYSAELHRLHGELLARPPHGQKGKAEAEFRIAIKVAQQQGATVFERKAKASLRHWSR